MRHAGWLFLLACAALQADAPAGNRPAQRNDTGESVLPGGRLLNPHGVQIRTGPGPFGIALSPAGRWLVTADGGPDRFGFTIVDQQNQDQVRHIVAPRREESDDGDDWRSTFLGLAFGDEHTLYAAEGETGRVRILDPQTGKRLGTLALNEGGYRDSYSTDLALDAARGLLYVVDQANFRLAIFDIKRRAHVASIRVGRLPFAVTLSADGSEAYVTNLGMFEYQALPGVDPKKARETGIPFPAYGVPSREASKGVKRRTEQGEIKVPALGDANAPEANSVAIIDVRTPASPKLAAFVRTGIPVGKQSVGGSSPSGILLAEGKLFITNANQDRISVIDPATRKVERELTLRIPGYEAVRGILPIGLAYVPDRHWLLVAEAGINAVGVVQLPQGELIGHIPVGWFPTRIVVNGNTIAVCNAKGHGTGPNSVRTPARPRSLEGVLRHGTISRFALPDSGQLTALTRTVFANNGMLEKPTPAPLPGAIEHVVIIVKENRTFDEVFGDLPSPRASVSLARFGAAVTPNHHEIAKRWATSDNFYSDSEVSVDGHHWLVGSYPNAWVNSSLFAAYGGQKQFRLPTTAPGRLLYVGSNSSVHPEDQLEAGALWHHLERHRVSFYNFGEGFELAGIDEGKGLTPTGGRFLTNVPMPEPLYRNTSRRYPGYNTNIPDQYRAGQFLQEMEERYGKGRQQLPRLLFIHLPNDHTASPRPADGYPSVASFVADNDLALGRILEYLSHSRWWPKMAVLITEDDAQGGVDHIDSHRTVLLVASPYVKRGHISAAHSSFPGLLKTAFRLLRIPPLNLYDATATDLADCFTTEADLKPYDALPVDPKIFDPRKAREATDGKPAPVMDGPNSVPYRP